MSDDFFQNYPVSSKTADAIFGGTQLQKPPTTSVDLSAFTLASLPPKEEKPIADFTVSSNRIEYIAEVPWHAPPGFSFKSHDQKPTWTEHSVNMIGNALSLIQSALTNTPHQEFASDLLNVLIDPDLRPGLIAPGHWVPEEKTIYLDPKTVSHYFEIVGLLLHEGDHAKHEKSLPASYAEHIKIEVRAHSNTSDRLELVDAWIKSLAAPTEMARKQWDAQSSVVLAAQKYGLAEYLVIQNFVNPINKIILDALDKNTLTRSCVSTAEAVMKKSFYIGARFKEEAGMGQDLHSEMQELFGLTKLLASQSPIFVDALAGFEKEYLAFVAAKRALESARIAAKALSPNSN